MRAGLGGVRARMRPMGPGTHGPRHSLLETGAFAGLAMLIAAAAVASFLPFVPTRWWAVRLLDFPRVQFAIVTAACLACLAAFRRRRPRGVTILAGLAVAALGADAWTLWPYSGLGAARAAEACPDDRRLTVMISNVLLTNRRSQALLEEVRAEKPDLFLAMEVDAWWDRTLEPLAAEMPFGATKVTGSYYGIRLFSRLPLADTAVRFLAGRDTPSIITGVTLRDGSRATFVGLHPRPPLIGQSALPRDAELYAAAQLVRDRPGPAILAGDLNATPWEDAVRRLRRVGDLASPRQGRGYYYTFDAQSWWAKWPLDQIDYTRGFAPLSLARLGPIGSDHYPFVVRLCRDAADERPPPSPLDDDDRARIGDADRAAAATPPSPPTPKP